MQLQNKEMIGKQCIVGFEGERRRGKIANIVESCMGSDKIILYCVRFNKRIYPDNDYDVGANSVEIVDD